MRDGVADVLAQRAALDRGAGAGLALSLLLHGGLIAIAVYAATHASPPQAATMVNIQFANMPRPPLPRAEPRPASRSSSTARRAETENPRAESGAEDRRAETGRATAPTKVEKNTVPLSPFGKSTKKGSETPPAAKPAPPRHPLPRERPFPTCRSAGRASPAWKGAIFPTRSTSRGCTGGSGRTGSGRPWPMERACSFTSASCATARSVKCGWRARAAIDVRPRRAERREELIAIESTAVRVRRHLPGSTPHIPMKNLLMQSILALSLATAVRRRPTSRPR